MVRIAQIARLPGKIGHLKAVGLHNEGVIEEIIALVEAALAQGTGIVSDQYPYDGAATASLTGIIVAPPGPERAGCVPPHAAAGTDRRSDGGGQGGARGCGVPRPPEGSQRERG